MIDTEALVAAELTLCLSFCMCMTLIFIRSVKKPVLFVCKPAEDVNQRLAEVDYKTAIMNDGARDFLGGY